MFPDIKTKKNYKLFTHVLFFGTLIKLEWMKYNADRGEYHYSQIGEGMFYRLVTGYT